MASVVVTQASRGNIFEMDGELFEIVDTAHTKPGKGPAYVQMKYRSLKTGRILDKRFNSSETIERVHVEDKPMEFLYKEGDQFVFMDSETYDQVYLATTFVGDKAGFLKDNAKVKVAFRGTEALGITLPTHVVLRVEECDPASKQSGTNVLKAAKLETGMEIKVPLYIEPGTLVKVDTRTVEFTERVKDEG